jgi:hypothetical protein
MTNSKIPLDASCCCCDCPSCTCACGCDAGPCCGKCSCD